MFDLSRFTSFRKSSMNYSFEWKFVREGEAHKCFWFGSVFALGNWTNMWPFSIRTTVLRTQLLVHVSIIFQYLVFQICCHSHWNKSDGEVYNLTLFAYFVITSVCVTDRFTKVLRIQLSWYVLNQNQNNRTSDNIGMQKKS